MPAQSIAASGKSLFRRLLVVVALTSLGSAGCAMAATVTAHFTSESTIPVTAAGYAASGNTVNFSLGFAPSTGADLMVVKNTNLPFISGRFANLAQGQEVGLIFNGINYKFVANYYGGSGNDLILHWKGRAVCAWGANGGALGDAGNSGKYMPVTVFSGGVLAGKSVIAVDGGSDHSIALASDGTVATWGYNTSGELGRGDLLKSTVPVPVKRNWGVGWKDRCGSLGGIGVLYRSRF